MSKHPYQRKMDKIKWLENKLEQLRICSILLPIQDENYSRLMNHIQFRKEELKKLKREAGEYGSRKAKNSK